MKRPSFRRWVACAALLLAMVLAWPLDGWRYVAVVGLSVLALLLFTKESQ